MHQETVTATTVGIDLRLDGPYCAEVSRHDDEIMVERLCSGGGLDAPEVFGRGGSSVALAVPDAAVMVKNIQLPPSSPSPVDPVIRFELAESLLEDISEFQLQTVATSQAGRYLGLICRHETLVEVSRRSGLPLADGVTVTHQMRALALGRGYVAFCERAAGELIGLVDLSPAAASVCLLLQDGIVDLAAVDMKGVDLDNDAGRKQFAIDLKTVINFRRAALQDHGVGLPLSTIVLSGERVDGRLREMVRSYFPGGVEAPRFRLSRFRDDSRVSEVNPELFLVALGLAAN